MKKMSKNDTKKEDLKSSHATKIYAVNSHKHWIAVCVALAFHINAQELVGSNCLTLRAMICKTLAKIEYYKILHISISKQM